MEAGHLHEIALVFTSSDGNVQLFRCWDEFHKKTVKLKELRCESVDDFNAVLKESTKQSSLVHPCICRLYECYLKQDQCLKCVLVTDWHDKSLTQEITHRAQKNLFWTESAYLELLYHVTDALAYAQQRGIAHQAICPEHLYVTDRGLVVVGEFGLTGEGLEAVYRSPDGCKEINRFKSDVYSLGVTFLAAALLRTPQLATDGERLEATLQTEISQVQYSDKTQNLLKSMLSLSSANRPDFLQLKDLISAQTGLSPIEESQAAQSRRQSFKKCLQCKKRAFQVVGTNIVGLRCNPSSHVFCSPHCFKTFVTVATCDYELDLGSVLCPKCKAPVFPEFAVSSLPSSNHSCCQCGSDLDRPSFPKQGNSILLPCQHGFCSRSCLLDYVRLSTDDFETLASTPTNCPKCEVPINAPLLIEALGGIQKYTELLSVQHGNWDGCNECTAAPAEVRLSCGHGFCKLCVRARYEVYRIQGRKNWLCPVCHQPISPNKQSICALS